MRFADRVGKGLRSPPRDALIADSVDARHRGRAFGFHRAMDTLGAALGPLVAWALLRQSPHDLRRIFGWSVVPAALAVVAIVLFVRAPRRDRLLPRLRQLRRRRAQRQQPHDRQHQRSCGRLRAWRCVRSRMEFLRPSSPI
jgi:MFS family permease